MSFSQPIYTCHWISRPFHLSRPNPSCLRKCQPLTWCMINSRPCRWRALSGKFQQDQGRPGAADISPAQTTLCTQIESSYQPCSGRQLVGAFGQTIGALVADLPPASMFSLFDNWRLAILEPTIARATLMPLVKLLASVSETVSSSPRATLLTLLRLITNALGTASLSRSLILPAGVHDRARTDASAPGPACTRGGREPGV